MANDYPSIDRIATLQQLIANFSTIDRMPMLGGTNRRENDVDHSFGLALTCWYLAPKIAPELSIEKIFKYALSHDIVELYAGDTFVFGHESHIAGKSEREDAAIERLYDDWPDFSEMVDYAKNYKDKLDEEAKFVKAVDKLLPPITIELSESSLFWDKHQITLDMERKHKKSIKVSDYVAPYYDRIIEWLEQRGHMYSAESTTAS